MDGVPKDSSISKISISLPPEMWREIFRWATLPDEVPHASDGSQSLFVTMDEWPFSHSPVSTKRTKISLSLVCQAWTDLTRPFLFETLFIVTDKLLSSSSLVDVENSSHLFAYARYLHILHNCFPAAPILRRILELCPDILRMRFDIRIRGDPPGPLDMFPSPTFSALRCLYLYNYYSSITNLLPHISVAAPQLEVLSYHGGLSPPKLDRIVTMPYIHTLELCVLGHRQVGECVTGYHFPQLRSFVDRSGTNVNIIAPHSLVPLVYDARAACRHDVFDFERLAKAEPTVVIFARSLIAPRPVNRHVFPSICQIIIAAGSRSFDIGTEDPDIAREGVAAGIFQCFNDRYHFPSLRQIDVLGTDVSVGGARPPFWRDWITKMGGNGIELKSHPGDSISIDAWPALA